MPKMTEHRADDDDEHRADDDDEHRANDEHVPMMTNAAKRMDEWSALDQSG